MKARTGGWFSWAAWALLSMVAPTAAEVSSLRPWVEYRAIMWVGDSAFRRPEKRPLFVQRLREMGVNTAMVHGVGADPQPWLDSGMPYYVENIVNRGLCLKWNAKAAEWDPFVTAWARSRDEASLVREYCLDDPQWRAWAREQMRTAARRHAPHQPVAYDIRDELSVTISANPFDYDFGPLALAAFREWLKGLYGSLAGLNREWETQFAAWEEVRPFTTDQIKNRMASGEALPRGRPDWQALQKLRFDPRAARQEPTRWNFAPWADFRTYMDLSLARVLDELRKAAREGDPHTPVGIEGTQMPHAFGGYDLWRLAQALDWVEPYDIGNAREIFGSFMPGKPILTTVGEDTTNPACRRLWHLLLQGDRGCIVWWSEDCIDWNRPDYALTPKARALAPVLREMTGPLGRLLLRAEREVDPIGIVYSQPSIQVDWLLESCPDGSTWLRRFSSHEAEHNRLARVRNSWLKALQDLGYSPVFVAAPELARRAPGLRALVLPGAFALAAEEARAVRDFLARKDHSPAPLVLADGTPGLFDEHGRLLPRGPLDDLFPLMAWEEGACAVTPNGAVRWAGDAAAYGRERLRENPRQEWAEWIGRQLEGRTPPVRVPAGARVAVCRYRLPEGRLAAFERNVNYQMSEDLRQAGGNQALEQATEVTASLPTPAHIYDLRRQTYLGHQSQIVFTLDPWHPSLFALLPGRIAEDDVAGWLRQAGGPPAAP